MHGTNPIRKFEKDSTGEYLQVREIFLTMQGEGPYAGRRAVFVRTTGCPLQCTYCDTIWDDANDPNMHFENISYKVLRSWNSSLSYLPNPLVVLTGGEPLRQNVSPLISLLVKNNCTVQVETAGPFWRPILEHSNVKIVVSPKTAHVHADIARHADAYKYVIRASDRLAGMWGLPVGSTQQATIGKPVVLGEPPYNFPPEMIYVSPCDEGDATLNKANLDVCLKLVLEHGYTLNLQQHKLVGLP